MNSIRLFELKRKSVILCPVEGFFELHPPAERAGSRATEGKKVEERVKKGDFFSQLKKFK